MTIFEAVVLGAVEGVTEFLPISSTAHLRLTRAIAGWPDTHAAAFDAVIQLGALLAVVVFFARDLIAMASASLGAIKDPGRRRSPEARRLVHIIVATIPIVLVGVPAKHLIEGRFRAVPVIATAMIVVAIVLAIVERRARHTRAEDEMTVRDALIIGLAQALAVVPGVSRSGITLLAAMGLGFKREAAARFSFLLSIPAIAGAGIFEARHAWKAAGSHTPLLVGIAVAAVVAFASIGWLLRFLRTRTTMPFVVYRIVVGVVLLIAVATGHLAP